jgi:hypothetical protein
MLEGAVLQSTTVAQLGQNLKHAAAGTTEPNGDGKVGGDAGTVVLLFPPPIHLERTLGRILFASELRLLHTFSPVCEEGTGEQVYRKVS